jgi:hypothetical protein
MITPIDLQADNVVGYRIEGNITTAELQSLYDQLTPRLERHDKMRVYALSTSKLTALSGKRSGEI